MNDRRRNTVRIDYDKLAEAIVKAQSNANKEDIKKAIIEANKEIENCKPEQKNIGKFYSFVIQFTLWILIAIGASIFVGVIIYISKNTSQFSPHSFNGFVNIITIVEILAISFITAFYSCLMLRDVEKSKDVKTLSSIFSNLIAFVALIVAAIALIK